jgi:membrane associated rhomboid family serine protease
MIKFQKNSNEVSLGNKMRPLVILIGLTTIIFVILAFLNAVLSVRYPEGTDVQSIFNENILTWFALSPEIKTAAIKCWTIIAHAFVHIGFWSLFSNMLWLGFFGYIFIELVGKRRLIPVFLYGTIAGGVAFLVMSFIFPFFQLPSLVHYFFGCSAAIWAVCAAAITIKPHYKLFPMLGGGISLWIVGIIYVAMDLLTLPIHQPVLHIAHFFGGVSGFLFIVFLREEFDAGNWMNHLYDKCMNLFEPNSNKN